MLDAFFSGVGEELARTWVARVLTPAFAFWAGGVALLWWSVSAGTVRSTGWTAALTATGQSVTAYPVVLQVVLIVGGLLVVAASAVIAERLTLPVLRLLEGYWWSWLRPPFVTVRRWLHRRRNDQADALRRRGLSREEHAEYLRLTMAGTRTPQQEGRLAELATARWRPTVRRRARLAALEAMLATTPVDPDDIMPTRLGDVLRAAERRPNTCYALDGVTCWPLLWLIMPAETRTATGQARAALDAAARAWLWGALFLVWTPISGWALVVGVGVPLLAYRFAVLPRAIAFGTLVGTAYDLHRFGVYDALHLPRPTSPQDERDRAGSRVMLSLAGELSGPTRYRPDPPHAPPPGPSDPSGPPAPDR